MANNLKMADRAVNTEADSLATQLNGGKFVLEGGKQKTMVLGRKSTRARDEKAIRELIDLEVA